MLTQKGCVTHQGVEGGHGEDPEAAQHRLGWAAGDGQEALGIGELTALQAGQVAAHAEQVHVELLQVLFPLLDLGSDNHRGNQSTI